MEIEPVYDVLCSLEYQIMEKLKKSLIPRMVRGMRE
jgi:hypothetical protein